MSELNLSFHTTFSLKKEDILRMIKVAEEEEKGVKDSQENLMAKTGLGNKKVSPIKSWSIRSGLVDRETGKLTPQGAIARKHDPYLQSPITDWLMHFYLSFSDKGLATPPPDPAEWGGWTWFVYSFLPTHPSFSRSTLDNAANQIYETDKKKAKSISDDLLKVLKAYTDKKDALAQINFLKSLTKDQYIAGEATLPPDELIAYFLAKLCERDFQGLSQINSDRLLQHPYGLSPILGISTDKVQDLLDRLSGKGIIEQYKTVPPFQIIPRWNESLDLLEKAYVNQ
ncbi:DUF4007 family protein [Pseudanabaena yagii]|uniref:DUF4007 family protein n=1 Tax=Pseudanabaena yagii GIHE-NHR1 TaxID=2722753 RepID=A0ABX1M1W7_9CYAN|nr:DUF4007 family protein [Pseudanabaena yagii]NMF61166.1 DUF4007 family protein [Pseudanabaena yagii GIHE-NHR1]